MNISANSTTTTFPLEWSNSRILLSLFLGLIATTTISGNVLVLYLFSKSSRRLRSPTHFLIANLAGVDLLVGLLVMPPLLTFTVGNSTWYWGTLSCTIGEYIHFALCAASMLSIVGIGMERYLAVRFPLRHRKILSRARVLKIMALVWIMAALLTSIPLTAWPMLEPRPPYTCATNIRTNFVFFISVSVYWIPVALTTLLYWGTYRNAVKLYVPGTCEKSIYSQTNTTNVSFYTSKTKNGNDAGAPNPNHNGEEKFLETKKRQTRLARKLSYIVGTMILFYGPLFVNFFTLSLGLSLIPNKLFLAAAWLRYFSSCANPFLYIFIVPGFKKEFVKSFWNERSEQHGSTGAASSNFGNTSSDDGGKLKQKPRSKQKPLPPPRSNSTQQALVNNYCTDICKVCGGGVVGAGNSDSVGVCSGCCNGNSRRDSKQVVCSRSISNVFGNEYFPPEAMDNNGESFVPKRKLNSLSETRKSVQPQPNNLANEMEKLDDIIKEIEKQFLF